ncbi:hypothetical protein LCGC14_0652120 [marine sediment metagenome]|uniref:Uncharacterized protein n=1 Tax=marine sediment metagenome TaxID=412755 RepID=A0A0F9R191_9ZZZZ
MVKVVQPTVLPLLPRKEETVEQIDIAPTTLPPPKFMLEPTPTPPTGGGGGGTLGEDVPQQTFATEEDIQQSIPTSEPQFTPVPTPTPALGGDGGGVTITEQVLAPAPDLPAIFPEEEAIAISRRQQLKIEAERRDRPFTRLETQRFLGGGLGVRALRRGTERAGRIEDITGLSFTEVITQALQPRVREGRIERQLQSIQDFGDPTLQTRLPTQPSPRGVSAVGEFLFGETGRQFVGFNIRPRLVPFIQPRDVTATQIQEAFRTTPTDLSLPVSPLGRGGVTEFFPTPSEFAGFGVRTTAELIPTTPGEVGITGGLIAASVLAPPIIGTGISLGVGFLGARAAFDPTLTLEQRTAGGLVGVLGGVGVVAGATPFIRGFGRRPTRIAREGFEFIPEVSGVGDIGLLQPSGQALPGVDLPPTSPLVRGGFGRRPGGEAQFLGREQLLATSQRDLFIAGGEVEIAGPFFVTPQEPGLGLPITRISRLALVEPLRVPETVEIGFGLPPRPQIGIIRGEVARTQRRGAFELGRGEELEAFRTSGTIQDIIRIGETRIRGQGVDIFEFQIGRGRGGRARQIDDFVSTRPTTRVSGEPLLGTFGIRTTRAVSLTTPALSTLALTTGISPPTTPPLTPPTLPPTTPTFTTGISPPTIPTVSPPTTPTISPPISPPIFPPVSPPRRIRGGRRKPKKKPKTKRKKARTPIRPSFTGIVLGIETPAFEVGGLGVLPGQIRGLRTGLSRPRRKTTKKKK